MGRNSIAYTHEGEWPTGSVDIHIFKKKSIRKAEFVAILLLPFACISLSFKCQNGIFCFKSSDILWRLLYSGLLVLSLLLLLWNPVNKESVIIMPAFGVQLETHYSSGRIVRRFIPACEILKPVILECVTPVTCYWGLSLLVCGKEQLVLVFKELRPQMKMLLPVWKALCTSINNKESSVPCGEGG